jgi:hypothetical protein
MARLRRARATEKAASKVPTDALKEIAETLTRALKEKELIVTVRGPFMTAVMLAGKDDQYVTKPVDPETELLFKNVRIGARSPLIFEFEPVGSHEYSRVEFEEGKLFDAVLGIEQTLINALGYYEEGLTWARAKGRFVNDAEVRAAEIEERRRLEEIERNASDPTWGMF